MTCGILNLPECIVDQLTSFIQNIVNAPLIPFLDIIRRLLTQPANVSAFGSLWAVIIYVLSTFYGLFIMAAGFNFIISGYNAERRERAKEWLQNVILMIFFVQASFLLYSLVAEMAAGITSGIINMIDPNFFLITIDNTINVGLEIVLGVVYLLTLLITIIALSVNYFLASIGVVFIPFGVFFYFIPPLRDIGKFIISKLAFVLFIPFFASLVLLGVSQLLTLSFFEYLKIVFMISAFMTINILMVILAILAVFRSVMGVLRSDIGRSVLFFKGHLLAGVAAQKPEQPSQYNDREYWRKVRKDHYPRGGV